MLVELYTPECLVDMGIAPSRRYVIERARDGRWPARKLGRRWGFTGDDVKAILSAASNLPRARGR